MTTIATAKRRAGRPPFPDGTARTALLNIRLSERDHLLFIQAAGSEPISQWARRVLLDYATAILTLRSATKPKGAHRP